MQRITTLLFCLVTLAASAQQFDGAKWKAPYSLSIPDGWGVERFPIPIEFAPTIPYKGVEDIRFAPGWANSKSEDYWSYAFLWFLTSVPETNEAVIENNLDAYYSGLVGRNIVRRKIPTDKLTPVKTTIKEVQREPGDDKTFRGTICMLDYMEQKPMTLNCVVHLKSCAGKSNGYIFHEISPKPADHLIWASLDLIWKSFSCPQQPEK
jgi:hypothetical protein